MLPENIFMPENEIKTSYHGTPADRVYVQILPPPVEERTYYEMVLGAEVLKGAAVDHTNLHRGRITLLPAHAQQVER